MSNRNYPYLAEKKRLKNTQCNICKKHGTGWLLEWQVSWFRGEDEVQKLCDDHAKIALDEHRKNEEAREKREMIAQEKANRAYAKHFSIVKEAAEKNGLEIKQVGDHYRVTKKGASKPFVDFWNTWTVRKADGRYSRYGNYETVLQEIIKI